MRHTKPEKVTPKLLAGLRRIMPYDPDHLPAEIAAHRSHPGEASPVASSGLLRHGLSPHHAVGRQDAAGIPRRYAAKGVERYGFHGLSYTYLLEGGRLDPAAARGRVILAHLGNGASLGRGAPGPEHRYQHGFHAFRGIADEYAHGRSGSRPSVLSGTHRANDRGSISADGESRIGVAGSVRDQFRPARFVRAGGRRPPGGGCRRPLPPSAKMDRNSFAAALGVA